MNCTCCTIALHPAKRAGVQFCLAAGKVCFDWRKCVRSASTHSSARIAGSGLWLPVRLICAQGHQLQGEGPKDLQWEDLSKQHTDYIRRDQRNAT